MRSYARCIMLFFLLILVSCSKQEPKTSLYTYETLKMGMPLIVKVSRKDDIKQIVDQTFDEVDRIYNNWNPNSEISFVNHLPAYQSVQISSELATFLNRVGEIVKVTQGRFDPTVDRLQKLWKHNLALGRLPSLEKLEQAQASVGWSKIHLTERLIYKENSNTAIDLSGVAKGYAVDLLALRLKEAGFEHIMVDWAGEIKVIGLHPEERRWNIAILGGETVEMQDESIATSGSYLQYWEVDDVYYTHIIDPFKKEPLQQHPISSVSVVLEDCATADALATALMLFSSAEEAKAWFHEKFPKGRIWTIENVSLHDPSPSFSLYP